jgi:hypothetical protein
MSWMLGRWSLFFALAAPVLVSACSTSSTDAGDEDAESDVTGGSRYAGVFTSYGAAGVRPEGNVWELNVRPDKTFELYVQGLYGCKRYAGYDCPSTWNDGALGYTTVSGTWSSTRLGLTVQPTGEGLPADPISLTMKFNGSKVDLSGEIANRPVSGSLDVEALDAKAHTTKDSDLDGTWIADSPIDKDGDQPAIVGSTLYVKGWRHTVKFDTAAHTWSETRGDENPTNARLGTFRIAGRPDGSGGGLVVLQDGSLPDIPAITAVEKDRLTFEVTQGRTLTLHRQTAEEAALSDALATLDITQVATDLSADEMARQGKDYPSAVSFGDAVKAALGSFLGDASDPESPLALMANVPADNYCHRADPKRAIRCFLDSHDATLGILTEGESAQHGEKVDANWIFTLSLPQVSDHGHWAVVDRTGKVKVYNYGFN